MRKTMGAAVLFTAITAFAHEEHECVCDPLVQEDMLIAEITEEEYIEQVQHTQASLRKQDEELRQLQQRLRAQEAEQKEREDARRRRQQAIEEYRDKWEDDES